MLAQVYAFWLLNDVEDDWNRSLDFEKGKTSRVCETLNDPMVDHSRQPPYLTKPPCKYA